MLTLESRRFPVLGEVSCFIKTLPNRLKTEQGVTITVYIVNGEQLFQEGINALRPGKIRGKQSPLTYSGLSLCLFGTMEYISDPDNDSPAQRNATFILHWNLFD